MELLQPLEQPLKQLGQTLDVNTNFLDVRMWDDGFYLIPAYIAGVFVLSRVYTDSNGKPVASKLPIWKPLMVLYNLALTVFSFTSFAGMGYYLLNNPLYTNDCGLAFRDPLFERLMYFFYISKYVEFADTVFLIVKGKRVSYLHWVHHIGAALDMGFTYLSGFEGGWIFVFLNGFIHTIMYFYYTCALLKIRLPGKSIITSMQIVQFLTGFTFVWHYKHVECSKNDKDQMFAWVYNYAYVGLVLLLFLNFYVQNYVVGNKVKKEKKQ